MQTTNDEVVKSKIMLKYNIELSRKTILVTGAAGFIGSNLVKRLLNDFPQIRIIGIDSITDYYDVNLKYERLKVLGIRKEKLGVRNFVFEKGSGAPRICFVLIGVWLKQEGAVFYG